MTSPGPGLWFTPLPNSQGNLGRPGDPGMSGSTRPRFYATDNGPVTVPSDWSEDDARQWVSGYNQYIARLTEQWRESSGLQRRQIESQIEDAKKGRENAMAIANLQAETSRYGVDQNRQQQMAELSERQRQFDANHDLNWAQVGLQRAQTATDYLSTPDRFVQAGEFLNRSSRILSGQPGAGAGAGLSPRAKTSEGFAALEGYGGNGDRQIDAGAAAGPGAGSDARVKVLKALVEAAPPSDEPGLDRNSYAVLNAARAIYDMGNLTPKQQAAIGSDKEYQQMLGSGLRRSGVNADAWWQRQQQTRPGQSNVRRAY